MKISCTNCGRAVPATDVNIDRLVARCTGCDSVFDVTPQLRGDRLAGARTRAQVPLPSAIKVLERSRALPALPQGAADPYRHASARTPPDFEIVRRWFTPSYLGLAFFCIAWDSFLVFWYAHATRGPWIMAIFPIGHVAVGIGLTYSTLAGFVNRTVIGVHEGILSVRHGPVPWPGNRRIPADALDQLYCVERQTRGNNRNSGLAFAVMARVKGGESVKLVSGIPDADQALYIEQAIESRLGIADAPVGGELSR